MLVNQGGQPGHVFQEDWKPLGPELLECRMDIKRVPEDDVVDDESKSSKLGFLAFPIALA